MADKKKWEPKFERGKPPKEVAKLLRKKTKEELVAMLVERRAPTTMPSNSNRTTTELKEELGLGPKVMLGLMASLAGAADVATFVPTRRPMSHSELVEAVLHRVRGTPLADKFRKAPVPAATGPPAVLAKYAPPKIDLPPQLLESVEALVAKSATEAKKDARRRHKALANLIEKKLSTKLKKSRPATVPYTKQERRAHNNQAWREAEEQLKNGDATEVDAEPEPNEEPAEEPAPSVEVEADLDTGALPEPDPVTQCAQVDFVRREVAAGQTVVLVTAALGSVAELERSVVEKCHYELCTDPPQFGPVLQKTADRVMELLVSFPRASDAVGFKEDGCELGVRLVDAAWRPE